MVGEGKIVVKVYEVWIGMDKDMVVVFDCLVCYLFFFLEFFFLD